MITYREAGVDIDKGNRFASRIAELLSGLVPDGVLSSIGGFSGLVEIGDTPFVLSATTDGVGTKLLVAQMANRHDTVGIDLVAMNVNDILATGSKPRFFLDYIAYSVLDDGVLEEIVSGIVSGLKEAKAYLLGGETAQMPGMYAEGHYDLAGFCMGLSRRDELFDGEIMEGDAVVGIASSGFHSNGYSLLRKIFFDRGGYTIDTLFEGQPLGELLLEPTLIYVDAVERIRDFVHAAAHITGGGMYENIARILPEDKRVIIEKSRLPANSSIYRAVQELGGIDEDEMYRVFNMGVGFVVVVRENDSSEVVERINDAGFTAGVIGYVESGKKGVEIV